MPATSPAEVEQLLSNGFEAELLGQPEEDWIDFKEHPYVLTAEKHRWELAKDVANMASNPDGGCIAIGFQAKQDPDDFEEVADKVKPFPCHLIDDQQYRNVVDSFAYPPVRGLRIRQFRRNGACLALILVPPQAEDDRPFLLKRIVATDGGAVDAFAVPTRDGSHTRWTPIGQVHRDLSDGRRSRQGRLEPGSTIARSEESGTPVLTRLKEQVDAIEGYMDWSDSAIYALATAPLYPPERIRDFYGGPLAEAFASPPQLRHAGFGIGWRKVPRVESGSLVAVDGDFRYRQLAPDAFFVVAVKAEEGFLGRVGPRPTGEARPLRINTTVLVEFTYEFCRFQSLILQRHAPGTYRIAMFVRGTQSRPWRLLLGRRDADLDIDYHEPSSDEWEREVLSSGEPETDAFETLARFYDLFGLPESSIPFSHERRIVPEEIVNLSR